MPEISVVTAVSPDKAMYLSDTYQSLTRQQGVEWEWSVVFDGKTQYDDYEFLADPRVRVTGTPVKRGAAWCRNLAVLNSSSPFLRNLDADDYLMDDRALAICVSNLSAPGIGFMLSVTVDRSEDGGDILFESTFTPYGLIARGYLGSIWRSRRYLDMRAHTLAVRRDLYWVSGGYRAMEFAEDVTLLVTLNELSGGWFESTPLSVYRLWNGQISNRDKGQELDETYRQVSEAVYSARSWLEDG